MLILLGETGVGKSSTINHLFGANVSRTSATRSETRNTTEYVLKEDDVELGVKDLSLGVIDTPGEFLLLLLLLFLLLFLLLLFLLFFVAVVVVTAAAAAAAAIDVVVVAAAA